MGVQQAKYPPTPKTVHVQIPGTCEIVMFCGERVKIAEGMNRADRPADSEAGPGLSGGAWQGAQVPAGESEGDVRARQPERLLQPVARGAGGGRRPQGLDKAKGRIRSRGARRGVRFCRGLDCSPASPTADSRPSDLDGNVTVFLQVSSL